MPLVRQDQSDAQGLVARLSVMRGAARLGSETHDVFRAFRVLPWLESRDPSAVAGILVKTTPVPARVFPPFADPVPHHAL
jgi:hypothetical protein